MGGIRLIARDFVGPDVEPQEVKQALSRRQKRIFVAGPRHVLRRLAGKKSELADNYNLTEKAITLGHKPSTINKQASNSELRPAQSTMHLGTDDGRSELTSGEKLPGSNSHISLATPAATTIDEIPKTLEESARSIASVSRRLRLRRTLFTFLRNLLMPTSASILVSFAIALVTPLKALFIPVEGTHIHAAPDGQPPLAFVMDTANFIGAASVPMGLVCLGSALARLHVPRGSWNTLPVGAILAFSVGKLLVFPVLGVLITKGLVHGGVIAAEDKVLQFICMYVLLVHQKSPFLLDI